MDIINKGITFGIITTKETQSYLDIIIDTIKKQQIPNNLYEIIIVGNCDIIDIENTTVIPFDESVKHMWITKKKNTITNNAKFENIVYLHDYIALCNGWYNGFLNFGFDWDICMNPISNLDGGSRILDWMGLPDDNIYGNVVLPYHYKGSSGMYIPGYYWIAKKNIMLEFPLNENYLWGEGEDIEWSKRVLGGFPPPWLKSRNDILNNHVAIKKHKYVINTESRVFSFKYKESHINFFNKYDLHSGDESRPLASNTENYEYLKYRKS
jgi:hypothetical protein